MTSSVPAGSIPGESGGGTLAEVLRVARRCETPRCMTTWGHDGGHVLVGGVPPGAEMRPLDRRLGDAALSWVAARLADEETVEAVARSRWLRSNPRPADWDAWPEWDREEFRNDARHYLAAVRRVLVGEDEDG